MTLNLLGILLAAVAGMGVGFAWYGPLFGKVWAELSGFGQAEMDEAKKRGMRKTYMYSFLMTLVMAYFLGVLMMDFSEGLVGALRLGLVLWLALIVPTASNMVLWEGKPKKLFYLNIFERLATIWVMTVILAIL